uniref:ZP domain-containing protein n=1 Tax=Arion vulgaris TaxID=1028688 RepID=A0A0B7B827_9EUPU
MKSLTMYVVILLIFCTQFYQVKSDDIPKIIADFTCAYNGYYDDGIQIHEGVDRDYVQIIITPVIVPSFGNSSVLLIQADENGKMRMIEILVLNATGENTLTVTPYNVTEQPNEKSTSSIVKHLLTLKREDFSTSTDCQLQLTQTSTYVFTGQWPICVVTKNGKHPAYNVTFSCTDVISTTPPEGPEKYSAVKIDLFRRGLKFPQKNVPVNYVCECD